MTAALVRLYALMFRAQHSGNGEVNVFDAMYEVSKPYAEVKEMFDRLIAEGKVVQKDIKTYRIIDGAEDEIENNRGREEAISEIINAVSQIAEKKRKQEKEEEKLSPLARRFAALQRGESSDTIAAREALIARRRAELKERMEKMEADLKAAEEAKIAEEEAEEQEEHDETERGFEELKAQSDAFVDSLIAEMETGDDDDDDDEDEDYDALLSDLGIELDDEDDEDDEDDGDEYNYDDEFYLLHKPYFDEKTAKIMSDAFNISRLYECRYVASEHLVEAMLETLSCKAKEFLTGLGVNKVKYHYYFTRLIDPDLMVGGFTRLTCRNIMRAEELAKEAGGENAKACSLHLLKAIVECEDNTAVVIFKRMGVDMEKLTSLLDSAINHNG